MRPSILFKGLELFREDLPKVETLVAKLKALPIPEPPYIPKAGDFFVWSTASEPHVWSDPHHAVYIFNEDKKKELAVRGYDKHGSCVVFLKNWLEAKTYVFKKVDSF